MTGPRPSIWDRVESGASRLFGVPRGLLDDDESRYATRQGLLSAGSALLAAPPSPVPTGPLDAILSGLGRGLEAGHGGAMEGIQVYEALAKNQTERAKQVRLQRVLKKYEGAGPDQMDNVVNDLVAAGLYDEAAKVSQAYRNDAGRLLQVDKGGEIELTDPKTGKVVRTVPKSAPPNAPNPTRDDARAIYGQFLQQTTKHLDVADAYRRVMAAGQNPSAAGDIALLTGFMKLVDPGSTVREGEFATAQNSGGVPDRVRALYNRLLNGERLTEPMRKDFMGQAGHLAKTMKESLDEVIAGTQARAKASGLDPSQYTVTYDYFNGLSFPGLPGVKSGSFMDRDP